jgi:dihydrofolate reductase
MNKIILYIAVSQDGFIADNKGKVDWLPHPKNDHELEIVGFNKLIDRIDTIIMGSNSYRQILGFGSWAWDNKHTYVFSSQNIKNKKPYITITNDSPVQFLEKLKVRDSNKDIWLLGGAKLAQSFEQENFIDEIILTIVPKELGSGIALDISFNNFAQYETKDLLDGIVQKIYYKK